MRMDTKKVLKTIMPIPLSGIFLFLAYWASVANENELFYILLTGAIITSLGFPALPISLKIDERFDNLEKLLRDMFQNMNEKPN